MAVILANCTLTAHVLEHAWARDAMGVAYPTGAAVTLRGPYPGAVKKQTDGNPDTATPDVWSARVDPRAWELRSGDRLTDGTRTWVVTTAKLIAVPGASAADYIACTCTLDPPQVP